MPANTLKNPNIIAVRHRVAAAPRKADAHKPAKCGACKFKKSCQGRKFSKKNIRHAPSKAAPTKPIIAAGESVLAPTRIAKAVMLTNAEPNTPNREAVPMLVWDT